MRDFRDDVDLGTHDGREDARKGKQKGFLNRYSKAYRDAYREAWDLSRIARSFHERVRVQCSPDELARADLVNGEIDERERNRADWAVLSVEAVGTHDAIAAVYDPNEDMAKAFEEVVGRELAIASEHDVELWNRAWDEARRRGYSNEWEAA